jgi:hypothetical protein
MTEPINVPPEELEQPAPPTGALGLLRRSDFRRLYLAISASEIGDALQYIALMWVAFDVGGPLGVVAVRLADSVPALVFGLHGGLAADRWNRRGLMISADLARAIVLVPLAIAGLTGHLPILGLVLAAFCLETATSYFEPAYGALLPSLVDRSNVQQANALVRTTANALSIGGWALGAGLLAIAPISVFFAINAASFVVSALLLSGIRHGRAAAPREEAPRIREGFAALRPRPALAAGVIVLGLGVTISAGTWIGGIPTLVRDTLHHGAGGFSLLMIGYAVGSVSGGLLLARYPIRRKARVAMLSWLLYLPGYGLIALGGSLGLAALGAAAAGLGQGSAIVLLNSAAQEDVPDALLGRVMGLISLVHRGAHATGLIFVAPLFAFVSPPSVFAGAALALPVIGLAGVYAATRAAAARAPATHRSPRS